MSVGPAKIFNYLKGSILIHKATRYDYDVDNAKNSQSDLNCCQLCGAITFFSSFRPTTFQI